MKSIPSGEIFPKVTVRQGEPPRHTSEGHKNCAYYMQRDSAGSNDRVMECPHMAVAWGAFYSEDAWKEAKILIEGLDTISERPDDIQRLKEIFA